MVYTIKKSALTIVMIIIVVIMTNSCTTTKAFNPGYDSGLHNGIILNKSTLEAIAGINIPDSIKSSKIFIEVLSKDEGRIYGLLAPKIVKAGIEVTSNIKVADYILRVSDRLSGVNQRYIDDWFTLILISTTRSRIDVEAKTILYYELFNNRDGSLVYSDWTKSQVLRSTAWERSIFWILIFPILPIETFAYE